MKKAFLVEYSIKTRVIADVPEDYEPGKRLCNINDGIIIAKAGDKILSDAQSYVTGDNIVLMEEDTEMPYDSEFDDE